MQKRRFAALAGLSLAAAGCQDTLSLPGEALVVDSVSVGQADAVQGEGAVAVTVRVSNPSAFAQAVEGVAFSVTGAGGVDRSSEHTLAAVAPGPAPVAPKGFVELDYTLMVADAATPETVSLDAIATNVGGIESLPALAPASLRVLRHAQLEILSQSLDGATCRDSRVATLTIQVRNDGESDAAIGLVGAELLRSSADVTQEFLVTAGAANPTTVAPAEEVALSVEIGSDPATQLGAVDARAVIEAIDARSSLDASPLDDADSSVLDVHDRAVLTVPTVTETRVTVSKGQTALAVSVDVASSGTVPATLDAGSLSFLRGGTPANDDYIVTPPGAGAVVPAGGMTTRNFTVVVKASATSGATTIGGGFNATDAVCEESPATSPAVGTGAWTVQSPAALQASSSLSATSLYAGEGSTVTVSVTNNGEATAVSVSPSLALTGCPTCGSLTPVNTTATDIAGAATAMFTYTYGSTNPTAMTVQSVSLSPSASGTDFNTANAASVSTGTVGTATVNATLPTACFTISPQTGRYDSTVFTFDASCSSDVETPTGSLTFEWELSGNGQYNDDTGMVATSQTGDPCSYNQCCDPPACADNSCTSCPGYEVYRIGLRVTDAQGRRGFAERLLPTVDTNADTGCVSTLADENDAGATPTAPGNTGFSFREAIHWANNDSDSNAICFASGLGAAPALTFGSALPVLIDDATHIVGRPGVSLDFTGLATGIQITTGDEATISGLDLTGITVAAGSNNAKVVIGDQDVLLYGNRIFGGSAGDGVVVSEDTNVILEFNTIEMNAGRGIFVPRTSSTTNVDPEIRRNVIRANGGHGIELSALTDRTGSQGPVAILNVIDSNGGDGIHIGPGSIDIDIHHNTIYGNSESGVELAACGFAPCTAQALEFGNNLVVANGDCGVLSALGAARWTPEGPSLFFGNIGGDHCGSITADPEDIFAMDPLFTDAPNRNFLLRPLSPARDAGDLQFFLDMNHLGAGNFNGIAADIGALETPP